MKEMKFNYKKIASVIASTVMLSSTVGFAAATTLYPAPFTEGSAIVYGSAGASTDMVAAIQVYDQLKARTSGTTTDATVSGDAKAIETASQPLYLGDVMKNTKATLTSDDLKTVLASGKLTDDDGKTYTYDLKFGVPGNKVVYGSTIDNLATPVLYADWDAASYNYTLKIIFPTAVNVTKLSDEPINLFGKQYVFSGNKADLTTTQVVLFEKATPVIINDGESKTMDGHTISVAVEDSSTVSISVDGVTESKKEGDTARIAGVDLYIKNVVGPSVAGTSRYAELYLNSNKITLSDTDEVTIGSDTVSGTLATFTSSAGKVTEIDITITPRDFDDDIRYTKFGDSVTDPVFKTVKLQLASATPDLTADSRDLIEIKPTGETKMGLKFTNKAGKVYDLDVLGVGNLRLLSNYSDCKWNGANCSSSQGTWGGYNGTMLMSGDYNISSTSADRALKNDYFITCSNEYTQIWKVTDVRVTDDRKIVKVQDVGSSSESSTTQELSLTPSGVYFTTSLSLADGNSATLSVDSATNNSVNVTAACSYLYTKKGAKIDLAGADNVADPHINITEETSYNGGEFKDNAGATLGKVTKLKVVYSATKDGKGMSIISTTPGGSSGTDYWSDDVGDNDVYYLTKYGTFIKQTGSDDKSVTTYYPEDAMKLGFYIGEVSSAIAPGSTGTAGGQVSIVQDSDIATVSDKNLIVVGGSCVNTVAAKILGSDSPICAEDFSTKTKVSAGGYIIKAVASPYNSAKVALLVAGYNAADTQNAVKRAMVIDGVKTDVGSEEVYPVTAAS